MVNKPVTVGAEYREEPSMHLTCSVTRDDVAALLRYLAEQNPEQRALLQPIRLITAQVAALTIAFLVMLLLAAQGGGVSVTLGLVCLVVAHGGAIAYAYLAPLNANTAAQLAHLERTGDLALLCGPKTVAVEPEVYRCVAAHSETIVRWSAVRRVVETETHLFVFYASTTACIIPKGSASPAELVPSFASAAQAAWAAAHEEPGVR